MTLSEGEPKPALVSPATGVQLTWERGRPARSGLRTTSRFQEWAKRPFSVIALSKFLRNYSSWALFTVPIILAVLCFGTYPFSDELVRKTLDVDGLSSAQKSNIDLAAQRLNDVVLKPGEEFSFNKIVGPRTEGRGYRDAPSYLGSDNQATVGGGICLVSSAIYQTALESGCEIVQRFPHLRTVRTVPPGLDATVWYGQCDLVFKNTLGYPVQLKTSRTKSTVTVSMFGKRPAGFRPAQLQRVIARNTGHELVVELFRRQDGIESLVSRDHYSMSR